jgi:cyclopropane-fatty-acyl-phospholipid synthase
VGVLSALFESGLLPDPLLRRYVRSLLSRPSHARPFVDAPDDFPAAFFGAWLGPRMKYSCGYWESGSTTLAESETAMLELVCARAGLADGMDVLDLGAGWGALALYIATQYPGSRVHAVTRAPAQAEFIRTRAAAHGLRNVAAECADARTWDPPARYDRVFAIEMLEHVADPLALLARASGWLAADGRVFAQAIIGPAPAPFFAGGAVLADDLLPGSLGRWEVDGTHYRRTLDAWLARLDRARPAAVEALGSPRLVRRWRTFLVACAELFAWNEGRDWRILHCAFARI